MYGLCKIHKPIEDPNDIPPFRLISSALRACAYSLAKFFDPVLKEYTINEYTVKDSFSFCKGLSEEDFWVKCHYKLRKC